MLLRDVARRWPPSIFGIAATALFLAAYSSGRLRAELSILFGFPATVGGLVLYFGGNPGHGS